MIILPVIHTCIITLNSLLTDFGAVLLVLCRLAGGGLSGLGLVRGGGGGGGGDGLLGERMGDHSSPLEETSASSKNQCYVLH